MSMLSTLERVRSFIWLHHDTVKKSFLYKDLLEEVDAEIARIRQTVAIVVEPPAHLSDIDLVKAIFGIDLKTGGKK